MRRELTPQQLSVSENRILFHGEAISKGDEYYSLPSGTWSSVPESLVSVEFDSEKHPPIRTPSEVYDEVSAEARAIFDQRTGNNEERIMQDLWVVLGKALNKDDELDVWFLEFSPGTPQNVIWDWFEAEFDVDVHRLMYGWW